MLDVPSMEGLGVGSICQSLQLDDGCPISRGGRLARLAKKSFPRFAFKYALGAEQVCSILAHHKLLRRRYERFNGGETRQSLGVLNECDQKARMIFRFRFDWALRDDDC